ncbi:MAG: hypothetical protein HONBIEJF_02725 [Fimbriimonadaceae bacterium]|nr:hypothetical protein [Fimbriimonadaceae bacterium]
MSNTINTSLRTALVALIATVTISANAQVLNGSFETGGDPYGGNLNVFVAGTPSPWYATAYTPDLYDNSGSLGGWGLGGIPTYNNMFAGMVAADGSRFIGFAAGVFNGSPISESFKQTMGPLVGGQSYTLNVQMAVDDLGKAAGFGGPYTGRGIIDVLINGSYVGSLAANTASLTWESRSVSFVAPTASSWDIEFVASMGQVPGSPSYMALDDISIVPEPASLLAVGAGLACLGGRRRKR